MLVFWKEKLVLLSVPKTGTTALEAALAPKASMNIANPPELKHAPVYRYNRFFRPMFEKACGVEHLELVAVMREPVSWLGSWYKYRRRTDLDGSANSTADVSFDEFVDAYCAGKPPAFANVGSQAKFLEPRPNGTRVSRLFRYEELDTFYGYLTERLGPLPEIGRSNVSAPMDLALDPGVEAKFRRKRPEEFELYASIRPDGLVHP